MNTVTTTTKVNNIVKKRKPKEFEPFDIDQCVRIDKLLYSEFPFNEITHSVTKQKVREGTGYIIRTVPLRVKKGTIKKNNIYCICTDYFIPDEFYIFRDDGYFKVTPTEQQRYRLELSTRIKIHDIEKYFKNYLLVYRHMTIGDIREFAINTMLYGEL